MKAVKSEDTIQRFLSKYAPAGLVHRFSTGINETIAKELYYFEQSRFMLMGELLAGMGYTAYYEILAKYLTANGNIENAIMYRILAVKAGHDSSYPPLVKLLAKSGMNSDGSFFKIFLITVPTGKSGHHPPEGAAL